MNQNRTWKRCTECGADLGLATIMYVDPRPHTRPGTDELCPGGYFEYVHTVSFTILTP